MKNFKVACIQFASGLSVHKNLMEISKYIKSSKELGADIVVLPENFALMASVNSNYLDIQEKYGDGYIQNFISDQAKKNKIWIVAGTIPIQSSIENKVFQTSIVFDSKGKLISSYNKVHLFDVNIIESKEKYKESDVFTPGKNVTVVDTPFCRLGLAVCYDLRFPELFRKLSDIGVDLVCLPAAFTYITGKAHWEHLIKSRAIENLVYFAASAQGGYHLCGRRTYGHSMIVNPWGDTLAEISSKPGVIISTIDLKILNNLRKNFPCLDHKRFKCK